MSCSVPLSKRATAGTVERGMGTASGQCCTCYEASGQQGSVFQKSGLVCVRTCLPFYYPEDGYGLVSCCCDFYEYLMKLDLGGLRLPLYTHTHTHFSLIVLRFFFFLAGKYTKNRNVDKSCTIQLHMCILNTVTLFLGVRLFPKHVCDRGKTKNIQNRL